MTETKVLWMWTKTFQKKERVTSPFSVLSCLSTHFHFSSLSTEQGQLENIPCSFLAQPRRSPGPLIKHNPFSFLSISFFLLSALSLPSICLISSSSQQPLSISLPSFHSASLLALHVYLSQQRFDINVGTDFRVNLYKALDLLSPSAGVNHAPRDHIYVVFLWAVLLLYIYILYISTFMWSTAEPTDTRTGSVNGPDMQCSHVPFSPFSLHNHPEQERIWCLVHDFMRWPLCVFLNLTARFQTFTYQTK